MNLNSISKTTVPESKTASTSCIFALLYFCTTRDLHKSTSFILCLLYWAELVIPDFCNECNPYVSFQVFLDYTSLTDQSHMETLMKEIVEEIRKLWDTLMGLEMELVDQLEVINLRNCKTICVF